MYRLWHSPLCPFAQRPRAVLDRLDVPYEGIEVDLDDRPEAFLSRTPTGKVPLLEEGEFRLYESLHVIEFLARAHDWTEAHASDPKHHARERLAMWRWDEVVVDAWYPSLGDGRIPDPESLDREVHELTRTIADGSVDPDGLVGFALATHWTRMRLLADHSPIPGRIASRHPGLAAWLDRAASMDAVERTLPSEETLREAYLDRYVGAATAA